MGIGTTSPVERLTVSGKVYIEEQGVDWNETTPGTAIGTLHFDPVGNGANNTGNAITFGASDNAGGATAQAGIYTRSDGSYGTKMYFATTDSYATGSKIRMMIDQAGNVGIGTGSPTAKLHFSANHHASNAGGKNYSGAAINASGGDIATGRVLFQGHGSNGVDLCGINNEPNRVVLYNYTDSRYLQIWDHTGNTSIPSGNLTVGGRLTVTTGGADGLVINQDTSSANLSGRLFFASNSGSWAAMTIGQAFQLRSAAGAGSTSGTVKISINSYSATSWTAGSDESIKENIQPIGDVLSKIQDYRCVEYNLIDDDTNDKKIGFIAQDWQNDFPQIVEDMEDLEDTTLGMKYTETIPVLLRAIQEQQVIIEDLKSRIETLEG